MIKGELLSRAGEKLDDILPTQNEENSQKNRFFEKSTQYTKKTTIN
jgi:hypothetical protein